MSNHLTRGKRTQQRMATLSAMKPDKPAQAQSQESDEEGFFGQLGSAVMGGLRQMTTAPKRSLETIYYGYR